MANIVIQNHENKLLYLLQVKKCKSKFLKKQFNSIAAFMVALHLLLLSTASSAQDCDVLFYYFEGGNSAGTAMDFTDDEGYILASTTTEFGAVGKDIQVVRVDQFGNELWSKIYGGVNNEIATDVETIDEGFLVLGYSEVSFDDKEMYISRLDADGNVIWENSYGNPFESLVAKSMMIDDEGNIVVAGSRSFWGFNNTFDSEATLFKFDLDGNLLEMQSLNFWIDEFANNNLPGEGNINTSSVIQTNDGNYLFTGLVTPRVNLFSVAGNTIIYKTDKFFNTIWYKDYHTCNHCFCLAEGLDVVEDDEGNFYIGIKSESNGCYDDLGSEVVVLKLDSEGEFIWNVDPVSGKSNDLIMALDGNLVIASKSGLAKMDLDGNILWEKEFENHHLTNRNNSLKRKPNGDLVVAGYHYDQGGDIFIAITDSLGNSCTNLVEGYVYFDENDNCLFDSSEHALSQFLVELNPGPLYDLTNEQGYYSFVVDTGDFEVSIHPINDLWSVNCPATQTYDVHFSNVYESSDSTDFGMIPAGLCPLIGVDLAWSNSRICNEGLMLIEYCNFGSASEDNLQINLTIPQEIVFIDANQPWLQNGSIYTFDIGTLGIGECGTIIIQDSVMCNAVMGEEVCLVVEALPGGPCAGISPVSNDTLCRILTNSFDPNDKLGFINDRESCFDPNDESASISYTIRFQNTGNDTAYRVMIVDTLSTHFDIRSIDLGPSSHPYSFEILDSNILIWVFEDINLPDSTTNYLGSMGALQFKIQSALTAELGLLNNAAIYFDANPPVITPVSEINKCIDFGFTLSATTSPAFCGGCNGAIDLTNDGNSGPYTYDWWPINSSSEDLVDLCPGSYTVTVTDSFENVETASFEVADTPTMEVSATSTDPICDEWNGTIDVSVTGGNPPYIYSWTGPGGPGCPPVPNQTGLSEGEYIVTVTDSDGCFFIFSIFLNAAESLMITASSTGASCNNCNGSIDLNVTGGTFPYTYIWSSGQIEEDLSDLCPGSYILIVTDAIGCTTTSPTIEIIGIEAPDVSVSSVNPNCVDICDGSISVMVENGTAPFTYDWFPDDLDGQTDAIDLCGGNYELTVTDDLGCTITTNIQLDQPEIMTITTTVQPACYETCNGSVEFFPSGGTPPYNFENLTELCPGNYQFSITDANGCIITEDVFVTEMEAITLEVDTIGNATEGQSNGFIQVNIGGGNGQFTYNWNLNGALVSTEQNPAGLSSGEYFVTVTDEDGCSQSFGPFAIDAVVSTQNLKIDHEIHIYPNPTTSYFWIEWLNHETITDPWQIKIYDLSGRLVQQKITNQPKFKIANLQQGFYLIQIEKEDIHLSKKVVVVK